MTLTTLYDFIMQKYTFDIINAGSVAAGAAVQAKGLAYRLRFNKDRDAMRQESYRVDGASGCSISRYAQSDDNVINASEEPWSGNRDYWLGRPTLTDIAINLPGEGALMLNDAIVNVSMQKEIVRTALVGRAGTIKEYISDGDYQLNISVGIVATDSFGNIIDQYPERAVEQLREILERPDSLEVSSLFLELFGIDHIVITGIGAKQATHSNRQTIELTCISDKEYLIASEEY